MTNNKNGFCFQYKIEKLSNTEVIYELTHVFGLKEYPDCLIRVFDDGVLINHSRNANLATNSVVPIRTGTRHGFSSLSP